MAIRVASGESLPLEQKQIKQGHAIEVRICAEDPQNQFLPAAGTITVFSYARTKSTCTR